jgi:hypothetical protein
VPLDDGASALEQSIVDGGHEPHSRRSSAPLDLMASHGER